MSFNSISDIYAENDRVHAELRSVVTNISDDEADVLVDGESWTIAQIVEHVSMVSEGATRICAKLLGKSECKATAASVGVSVSDSFMKHYEIINDVKLQAPERVRPTGKLKIADSLARMAGNGEKLRELQERFESRNDNSATFPHPYFGEMTAVEWLILIGGHEARHLAQIRRVLEKLT